MWQGEKKWKIGLKKKKEKRKIHSGGVCHYRERKGEKHHFGKIEGRFCQFERITNRLYSSSSSSSLLIYVVIEERDRERAKP